MAVSKDGIVAKSEDDKMDWTGHLDKKVFRLLTMVGGKPLGAGRKTFGLLPELGGRSVVSISRTEGQGCSLGSFDRMTDGEGWLIGGQTLALSAIDEGFVQEMFLCRSSNAAFEGVKADLRLLNFGRLCGEIRFSDHLTVEVRR